MWKVKRNKIIGKIKQKLKHINETKLDKELGALNPKKSNAGKYYEAERIMQRQEKRSEIVNMDGMIASTQKERCTIITDFIRKLFVKPDVIQNECASVELQDPFTEEKILKMAAKLKNNKSPGPENVIAEMIKYSPKETRQLIAKIIQLTYSGKTFSSASRKGNLLPHPQTTKAWSQSQRLTNCFVVNAEKNIVDVHSESMLGSPKGSDPFKQADY